MQILWDNFTPNFDLVFGSVVYFMACVVYGIYGGNFGLDNASVVLNLPKVLLGGELYFVSVYIYIYTYDMRFFVGHNMLEVQRLFGRHLGGPLLECVSRASSFD